MAARTWVGRALPVAQVSTVQVTAYDAATTYTLTVNGKSVSCLAAGTVNATAAALAAAWAARTEAEFLEAAAAASTDTVTLTGATAGRPFTVTSSVSGGTGTLGAVATPTAATGPNHWDDAANWAEGAVPADGDDVTIDRGASVLYALDQAAVTLASLTVGPDYPPTSEVGLPSNTSPANPAAGYAEYRDQRLAIGATACVVDTVSRRVRLDLSAAPTTLTVRQTGQPVTPGEDALDVLLDDAGGSTAVYLQKGSVGLNYQPGDAGTVGDLNVSFRDSQTSDVVLRCGPGLTLTNLDMSGGQVLLQNGATTVTKSGGTLTLQGGAVATLVNRGGLVYHDSAGTITTLTNLGRVVRRGFVAGTVTTATLYARSETDDRNGTLTWTNPPAFYQCRLAAGPGDRGDDVAWACFGTHKTLAPDDI